MIESINKVNDVLGQLILKLKNNYERLEKKAVEAEKALNEESTPGEYEVVALLKKDAITNKILYQYYGQKLKYVMDRAEASVSEMAEINCETDSFELEMKSKDFTKINLEELCKGVLSNAVTEEILSSLEMFSGSVNVPANVTVTTSKIVYECDENGRCDIHSTDDEYILSQIGGSACVTEEAMNAGGDTPSYVDDGMLAGGHTPSPTDEAIMAGGFTPSPSDAARHAGGSTASGEDEELSLAAMQAGGFTASETEEEMQAGGSTPSHDEEYVSEEEMMAGGFTASESDEEMLAGGFSIANDELDDENLTAEEKLAGGNAKSATEEEMMAGGFTPSKKDDNEVDENVSEDEMNAGGNTPSETEEEIEAGGYAIPESEELMNAGGSAPSNEKSKKGKKKKATKFEDLA